MTGQDDAKRHFPENSAPGRDDRFRPSAGDVARQRRGPQRVAVVGAGMVGLSTAWFLRERGVDVEVVEREHVAAGSSWGNAGWLAPALTTPLPEPAVLRYGLRAVLDPGSPVYVPISLRANLWRFLVGFARHCTTRRWRSAMGTFQGVNRQALDAFDELTAGGVTAPTHVADPFLVCFTDSSEREHLLEELAELERLGQKTGFDLLTGERAREHAPILTEHVGAAVALHGQRFIHPPQYLTALAESVRERGGGLTEGRKVHDVRDDGRGVLVRSDGGEHRYDAVVLATGAWLPELARPFGVRVPVQAGRGYSFTVPARHLPDGPIYLPVQRVACTPLGDRLRIAGMMEFRDADEPLDHRRVRAIVNAVRPFLRDVDLDDRHDEWVGSRPCTPDGLPLVGPTSSPRVFAAGGHGMWGIVLGPLTGRLLADAVVGGEAPSGLHPFRPVR
ncbi:NAD(P)/FAD-dependent oxidoreductase [Pseudonocardia endophytica]|uniref:D-amino-acid dehydrogenase n=1 Tax=Pseudonocardia endophytica TaxID=401976 RepID=A0A4R1HZH5_PSEEN|nr:D-amino-acid dehydrogenase [Pseudonocardia endophytica]